jgi:coenzyme PQQ synthesis protein D (PqqD)
MAQNLKGRVTTPDGVMFREIGGEAVLLNLQSESYFGLDEIGTRMWSALTEEPSIEAAYAALLAEFDVEAEALRADLSDFIEKLAEAGLVAVKDA